MNNKTEIIYDKPDMGNPCKYCGIGAFPHKHLPNTLPKDFIRLDEEPNKDKTATESVAWEEEFEKFTRQSTPRDKPYWISQTSVEDVRKWIQSNFHHNSECVSKIEHNSFHSAMVAAYANTNGCNIKQAMRDIYNIKSSALEALLSQNN